jgi:hypothetical protein
MEAPSPSHELAARTKVHLGKLNWICDTNCETRSGAIGANSCTLTCDIGYNGFPTAACNTNEGTFTISRAGCQDNACNLASSTGYVTTNCDTGSGAIRAIKQAAIPDQETLE